MPKNYKIKHYHHKKERIFRAKPHPLSIVFSALFLAALVFAGASVYPVVFDKIMKLGAEPVDPPSSEANNPPPTTPQEPEQPALAEPEQAEHERLRGVYAPYAVVSDAAAFERLLDSVTGTDINAVMLDIKNAQGQVLFNSTNEDAIKWGAVLPDAPNLQDIAKKLGEHGLSLIARQWAFRDELAARGNRANAIHFIGSNEMLWLDNAANAGGKPWLNPYSSGAQEYIAALALEAVQAGAELVVLESVQFPDNSNMGNTNFGPQAEALDRRQALSAFVGSVATSVAEAGARLGVYYPAVALTQPQSEVRYGGSPLLVADELLLLGVLPQQFAGGYSAGGLEIVQPLQYPASAAKTALEFAEKSLAESQKTVALIPVLQGGSESSVTGMTYSAEQIASQITAVENLGLEEYILYQTSGAYALK